jgi:hypothetical protein
VARRLDVARVTVDFSDVQDFEPLEAGEYPVLVEKVTYTEATQEGKYDYMAWELQITDGEFKGRKLWLNTSFSPKALFKLKEVLENLGLFEDELDVDYDEDSMLVTTPELAGLPAIAVVSVTTYNNRPSNNVDALIASDTPPAGAKKAAGGTPPKKSTSRKFQ